MAYCKRLSVIGVLGKIGVAACSWPPELLACACHAGGRRIWNQEPNSAVGEKRWLSRATGEIPECRLLAICAAFVPNVACT